MGIEPYKCDNSRLLSENNALHLEIIKIRDHYEKKLVDLKNTIRNLEVDKNYLDDHCFELVSKIQDMEQQGGSSKGRDNRVQHKKAFISTVRSNNLPTYSTSSAKNFTSRRCDVKNDHRVEITRLQNEIQLLKDETNSLKKQVCVIVYDFNCHFIYLIQLQIVLVKRLLRPLIHNIVHLRGV